MVSEIDRKIGRNLRLKRLRCRLSVDQLAEAIGCNPRVVMAYEHGTLRISAEILMKLSAALSVRPGYFLREYEADIVGMHADGSNVISFHRRKRR